MLNIKLTRSSAIADNPHDASASVARFSTNSAASIRNEKFVLVLLLLLVWQAPLRLRSAKFVHVLT